VWEKEKAGGCGCGWGVGRRVREVADIVGV